MYQLQEQRAAAVRELRNARKNLVGGWAFAALGLVATIAALKQGGISLLWTGLGLLGLVYALRSQQRIPWLTRAVADVDRSILLARQTGTTAVADPGWQHPRAPQ